MENTKRMVGDSGYEVRQSMKIGSKDILLAENINVEDDQRYLVCNYQEKGILVEYSMVVSGGDYLEAVQEFIGRINEEVEKIRIEQDARGLPADLFTAEHCYPHRYDKSIESNVVVIRAEVFRPEYRRGDNQLVWVTGGHGANANAIGRAVYCYHLNTGEHTRFERNEVLGIIKPESMPVWAKENLARLQDDKNKLAEKQEYAGKYQITERIEIGKKIFALGHNLKAPQPYGTWEGWKGVKGSFNYGHYFSTYEDAKTDLQDRSAKEQQNSNRQRSEKDSR